MTIKIICPLALRMKFLKEQNNFGINSIHSNELVCQHLLNLFELGRCAADVLG